MKKLTLITGLCVLLFACKKEKSNEHIVKLSAVGTVYHFYKNSDELDTSVGQYSCQKGDYIRVRVKQHNEHSELKIVLDDVTVSDLSSSGDLEDIYRVE